MEPPRLSLKQLGQAISAVRTVGGKACFSVHVQLKTSSGEVLGEWDKQGHYWNRQEKTPPVPKSAPGNMLHISTIWLFDPPPGSPPDARERGEAILERDLKPYVAKVEHLSSLYGNGLCYIIPRSRIVWSRYP